MVAIVTGKGTGLERSSAWILGSRGQLGSATMGRDSEGVYVNAASGNLVITRQDEFLIGLGSDISIDRTYNSQSTISDGDNSDNWRMGVYRKVTGLSGTYGAAGTAVTRIDWDGSETVYTWNGSYTDGTNTGFYVATDGAGGYDTLRLSGSTWTWTDGSTLAADLYDNGNGGRITQSKDADGNTLTYTYNANGRVTQVTDQNGEYTKLVYDATYTTLLRRVETWTGGASPALTRVYYDYDGNGRLATVKIDLSPADNVATDGNSYTTTYTYDGSSNRVASITQQDGSSISFTYVQVGGSYKVASYTQAIAAGVSRTSTFSYGTGSTTVTDPAGQKTILWYNANNELTQISYPPENANTTPKTVTFQYEADGDVSAITDGPGNSVTRTYDGHGNCILERDSAGNTIERTYSLKNELLRETRWLVPDPDGAGSQQPSDPVTVRYAYDGESHLRFRIGADGGVTEYVYDTPGQLTATIEYPANDYDLNGVAPIAYPSYGGMQTWVANISDKSMTRRTETTYDGRGNVSKTTSYEKVTASGTFDTSSQKTETLYVYNTAGSLLNRTVTNTGGGTSTETFIYDGMNRMTVATDFGGAVTRTTFFDASGQTVIAHANGLSEISTYDRAGELIAYSTANAGANLIDLSGWPGNPASVPSGQAIVPGWANYSAFTDETQWATTNGPDGLPVVAIQAGQLDASAEGGGNYTNEMQIDATKAYEFTWLFKLSAMDKHYVYFGLSGASPAYVENLGDGADNANPYFWYAYAGMQDTFLDPDKWYKVVGYVLPQGTAMSSAPLGGVYDVATGEKVLDLTSNFRWNPERPGNTVHSRFFDYYGEANQQYSTYFYRPEVRQVSTASVLGPDVSTSRYVYDNLGRLRTTIDPTGRRNHIMYDSVGRKIADIDADGSVTEYRYDGSDNLTSTTRYATRLTSAQLASLIDGNGNPTSAGLASFRPAASAEDQWNFSIYDAAQRLVQVIDGTGATTVYSYDGASRLVSTRSYATRLDLGTLSNLKARASNPNYWYGGQDGFSWAKANVNVAAATAIDGASAYQFTEIQTGVWQAVTSNDWVTAATGQTVTTTITVKDVSVLGMASFGLYGPTTGWGSSADAYATIISGPGAITYQAGGYFQISGLSTTEATRITITRTARQAESLAAYFYLGDGSAVAGRSQIVSAPILATNPVAPILPAASTNDRLSRNFFDKDGRVIASLDGGGGLTEFVYDENGLKIRETGRAKAADSSLWATGTLAQLQASAGTNNSDRRTDYVYDARGFLRYTLNSSARATELVYDPAGRVIRIVDYVASINSAASYSMAYVASQLTALGLANHADNRITRSVYDAAGRLAFSIDAGGAVAQFAYDNMSRIIKETRYAVPYGTAGDQTFTTMQSWATSQAGDTANRSDRTVFNLQGQIAYTVDAEGYVTENQYDLAGRVTKTIRYADVYTITDSVTKESLAAQIGAPPASAVAVTYSYDADGRLSQSVDGVGAITRFTYDAFGQVIDTTIAADTVWASTTRQVYDALGRTISETRGYGTAVAATTQYGYDALGNLISVTDLVGHVTTRTYDNAGRVLTVIVPVDGVAANNLVTSYTYDAFGDVTSVTDARGFTTFNYYDALGRLWLQSDNESFLTQTLYDNFNQVYQVVRRAVRGGARALGSPPTINANSADAFTTFSYDKLGRVIAVTDAENYTETYWYNAFGEKSQVRNKLNGLVQNYYDRRGALRFQYAFKNAYLASGAVQAGAFYENILEYDAFGRVSHKVEAYGLAERRDTWFYYDKAGRLTATVYPQVQTLAQDLVTQTAVAPGDVNTYNARGELVRTADKAGGITTFYYDALGRRTLEIDAAGTARKLAYDAAGRLYSVRTFATPLAIPTEAQALAGTAPTPAGDYREIVYDYDWAGRRVSETVMGANQFGVMSGASFITSSGHVVRTWTYDKAGNAVKQTDGAGTIDWFFYDGLGRKVAQIDRENYLTMFTLDANGNSTWETRYATRIASAFSETTSAGLLPGMAGSSANDRTTSFTYDRNGRRLSETRVGIAASSVSGTGALSTSTLNATILYSYNGLGLVTSKTEANGDYTSYTYDDSGRLTATKGAAFIDNMGTNIRLQTDLYYDGLGNVVRSVQHGDVEDYANDRVTTFVYGAGGRLATQTDSSGAFRNYYYDAAGRVVAEMYNRSKADGTLLTEAIAYRYDIVGRLITQSKATYNGSAWVHGAATRRGYNAYGEVTGRGLTAGPNDAAVYQETFDYDLAGRLWRSNEGDGSTRLFLYDLAGNRTLTLSSTGNDLNAVSQAGFPGWIGSNGDSLLPSAVTTIAVYDKRGQQLETREPSRQLTTSTTQTLVSSRAYNAFGEVTAETDARGYTTNFTYNTMGRLTKQEAPSVNWTSEAGAVAAARPTEDYYYDISGRLVATRDANGNLTTRVLENGTGHEGDEALVHAEYHADGGAELTWHNVYGDARLLVNALGQSETRGYDDLGRVTSVTHRGGLLVDYYGYDQLGQRTRHWNSQLGASVVEKTDYDLQGRVTSQIGFGGDSTTYSYGWYGTMVTGGLGAYGGWERITTQANGLTAIDDTDYFGRMLWRKDLGNHVYTFNYDKAGRLTSQAVGGQTLNQFYFNTGRLSGMNNGSVGDAGYYGYDAAGNLTWEWNQKANVMIRNAAASYDALGRMTSWSDSGYNNTIPASTSWEYDKAGNIRRVSTSYRLLDAQGNVSPSAVTQDYWYRYDNMNRFVVTRGALSGGVIQGGIALTYDVAGNRKTMTTTVTLSKQLDKYVPALGNRTPRYHDENSTHDVTDDGGGVWSTVQYQYSSQQVETYNYNADGTLDTVYIAVQDLEPTGNLGKVAPQPGALGASTLRADYNRDAMGRVTWYKEYGGAEGSYERTGISYDAAGRLLGETVNASRRDAAFGALQSYVTYLTNSYTNGLLTQVLQDTWKNGSDSAVPDSRQTYAYAWWDSAQQSTIGNDNDNNGTVDWTTTYSYDARGKASSISIYDGRPRTVSLVTDLNGMVVDRDENDNQSGGDPRTLRYVYGGVVMGEVGNNGTANMNYLAAISDRLKPAGTGAFRGGDANGAAEADFDQSFEAINAGSQAGAGSAYIVSDGDTLQSIAMAVWGDAQLWYLIAEANGLSLASPLVGGQSILIPNKVANSHNSAATFKPYDPNEALGDNTPGAIKPNAGAGKKGNKCGVVGQILLVAVAVAVTIATHGAAVGALGSVLGGAASAVAGSVASQAVGLATGLQDKFDFKGVAIAAITAGITQGLGSIRGPAGAFLNGSKLAGSRLLADAARAVSVNALTQGVATLTGLQDKFSWAGVASAGIVAGVSGAAARGLRGAGVTGATNRSLATGASLLSGAAARSLLTGTNFGDNLIAVLPDVIATTLGNFASEALAGTGQGTGSRGTAESGYSPREADVRAYDGYYGALNAEAEYGPGPKPSSSRGPFFYTGPAGRTGPFGQIVFDMIQAERNLINAFSTFVPQQNIVVTGAYAGGIMSGALQDAARFTGALGRTSVGGLAASGSVQVQPSSRGGAAAMHIGIFQTNMRVLSGIGAALSYEVADNHVRTLSGDVIERRGRPVTVGDLLVFPVGRAAGPTIRVAETIAGAGGRTVAEAALPAIGGHLPNAGGVIRQFTQQGDQVYYRVFSESPVGSFLTAVPPRSSAYAREALALPPGNQATFIQEVLVPNGTPMLRSRALPQPAWGQTRGGAEQFELLEHIPTRNFGPGRPLP